MLAQSHLPALTMPDPISLHRGSPASPASLSAGSRTSPATPTPSGSTGERGHSQDPRNNTQSKKHKVLHRPQDPIRGHAPILLPLSPPKQRKAGLIINTETSSPSTILSQPTSPRTLKHKSRRIGTGPEPPPTPPTHSRKSSVGQSAVPSSPTIVLQPQNLQTPKTAPVDTPTTPSDQRSPPTPDVTPPQPASRPRALRPLLATRGGSVSTNNGSRNDSFKTAPEEPSSGGEEGKSIIQSAVVSSKASQDTIRKPTTTARSSIPSPDAINMALARLSNSGEDHHSPRASRGLGDFQEERNSPKRTPQRPPKRIELELDRDFRGSVTVTVGSTKPGGYPQRRRRYAIEDTDTKQSAARSATDSHEHGAQSSGVSNSDASITSQRRSSGTSTMSIASTIEVLLIDGPAQKQRTLRHVRNKLTQRDRVSTSADSAVSVSAPSASASTSASVISTTSTHRGSGQLRVERGRRQNRPDSHISTAPTESSVVSGRARRDVQKNGASPVVVSPGRISSYVPSNRDHSVHSTSSRQSAPVEKVIPTPAPLMRQAETPARKRRTIHEPTPQKQRGPIFERPSCRPRNVALNNNDDGAPSRGRRGPVFQRPACRPRAFSFTDGDELTMEFAPPIPPRSSSLSAPTSRATSRAGSMTTESVRTGNAIHNVHNRRGSQESRSIDNDIRSMRASLHMASPVTDTFSMIELLKLKPLAAPLPLISPQSEKFEGFERAEIDSQRRSESRQTPFSVMSVDTIRTTPELSNALAVHMFPHQNSSVLMVDHSARPSEASDDSPRPKSVTKSLRAPEIFSPGTPTQQPRLSLNDVDSPLRNPRSPPEPPMRPPVIGFIPATPSGVTPGPDVQLQMGNFYESMVEVPPSSPKRLSLVRRALGAQPRNTVVYPPNSSKTARFLSRALGLPKRKNSGRRRRRSFQPPYRTDIPLEGDIPPEENKLHPFWEPLWAQDDYSDGYEDEDAIDDQERGDESAIQDKGEVHLKYPMFDNRPPKQKRRLSETLKRTFAILPTRGSEDCIIDDEGTERRTIVRTSSGNLRVIQRSGSAEPVVEPVDRPYTTQDGDGRRSFWRGASTQGSDQDPAPVRRRRFSLSEQLEELQDLPRRISEKRREKRTRELRQQISGPKEVRDGVEDVIRSGSGRDFQDGSELRDYQGQPHDQPSGYHKTGHI